ncbi:aldo/keto reductase [Colletotrichum tofieldiae]|nr:aldo/keto reductase [Colletotrichum tofieldiae]GKT76881.1 aldo/keto reductase [Colletotrichum tofieldiae]GKT92673.1 aldo keto reductase [Colletotrichum tofieldiae]
MARGEDVIPIHGTTKIKYLEENIGALKVKLSAEEERETSALVNEVDLQGDRGTLFGAFADSPAL